MDLSTTNDSADELTDLIELSYLTIGSLNALYASLSNSTVSIAFLTSELTELKYLLGRFQRLMPFHSIGPLEIQRLFIDLGHFIKTCKASVQSLGEGITKLLNGDESRPECPVNDILEKIGEDSPPEVWLSTAVINAGTLTWLLSQCTW